MAGKKYLGRGYREHPDGQIEYRFTVDGKRYSVSGRSMSEVKQREIEKRKQIEDGTAAGSKNITLDGFFQMWQDIRRVEVKGATMRKQSFEYAAMSKKILESTGKAFGSCRLKDITQVMVLDVRRQLLETKKTNSVNQSISLLRQILQAAVESDYIRKNPAKGIKAIKVPKVEKDNNIHHAISLEDTGKFLKKASCSWYRDMFIFMLYTGVRHGEAASLRFGDIEGDTVHIQRTITKSEAGAYQIGDETKTFAGERTIPLLDEARQALNDQKEMREIFLDRGVKPEDLVFLSPMGKLCDVTDTNREIARICKRSGVERFTCHCFRDTFATRWIESGGDYKTLSSILGHTDISITMNVYAKTTEDFKQEQIRKIRFV